MEIGDKVQPVKDINWEIPRFGRSPLGYTLRPQYTYTVRFVSRNGKWILIEEFKTREQPCLSTNNFRVVKARKPALVLAAALAVGG